MLMPSKAIRAWAAACAGDAEDGAGWREVGDVVGGGVGDPHVGAVEGDRVRGGADHETSANTK
jgi:hypothetical protein